MAAEEYFTAAEEFDRKFQAEKDSARKTALMVVAAQNYFYCSVNFIEAVFALKLEEHSFNHENRMRKILEHQNLFSEKAIKLYALVDRSLRNKVTYRGENGEKYKTIKELARLMQNERQV